MDDKYKFLKIGAVVFKGLAWLSVVIGVISGVIIFIGGGTPEAPRSTGFIGLLLGVVYYFLFFTASEVITLLLDVHNKLDKGGSA
ncbi:MAG: hypothetical protein V3S13_03425 [Candidatus Omnitrophota bacterium]